MCPHRVSLIDNNVMQFKQICTLPLDNVSLETTSAVADAIATTVLVLLLMLLPPPERKYRPPHRGQVWHYAKVCQGNVK